MTTATEQTDAQADEAADHHPGDGQYVKIALILGAITALEVGTYFIELNNAVIASLYVMMILKFIIVISYFMHLKYDSKIFRYVFVGGLAMAIAVYLAVFASTGFFVGDFVG